MKQTSSAQPPSMLGGGEMGALIRAKDWSKTPLGPPSQWPQTLRVSLNLLLHSAYPMFIWWGAELIMFHNDAYLPVLGKKHPKALGRSAREVWSEIWGQIGAVVDGVFQGSPFYAKDLLMFLGRKGFLEETYWTFSYSPILSEEGEVCGLFCACNEETEKIVRQRRLQTLKEISELSCRPTDTLKPEDLCNRALQILAQNPGDIPFAALYLLENDGDLATLVNTAGISENAEWFPQEFSPEHSPVGRFWQIQQVVRQKEPVHLSRLQERYPEWQGQVGVSSDEAMVIPLRKPGQEAPAGFLICGISPFLELDEEYVNYLNLLSRQIATGLAFREMDGRLTGLMVIAADETSQSKASKELARKVNERTRELVLANQELRRQKEFVDAIIDASVDLITVFDTQKRILSINSQVETIYGLKREEVIGKPFHEVFPSGLEAEKMLDRCLMVGETIHNPLYKSAITGRIFESFVIPLVHPNGEVYAAISMAHDHTLFMEANYKLQEAEMRNKELEQFAYLASHDLQEPLNTITSFIALLEEGEVKPQEMAEYFSHIKNSSHRLSNLITDLLEYSRIGHRSKPAQVDFQQAVGEVLADMQAVIQRKKAQIEVGPLPALKAYPSEIRLLFQNLISNALKFQKENVVPHIHIQAWKNVGGWHFAVKDNGIGMEEQYLDRVFIIFQRLHPASEYEGTGIGLAHCKKIIDLHRGRIWVESTPGLGSKFHFTISDRYEND